jgi:putative nucleotidyltransferase with HDIG domain
MITRGSEAPGSFGAEGDLDRAIEALVARGAVELPPYPGVVFRIAELVRGGDYGLDELARLVRSDPVLAADLLRVANSAYYGPERVVSLEQAVVRVGEAHLEQLALASALGLHARAQGPLAPLRRMAWHDALASAVLCRGLAGQRGLSPEEAFSCGLLHDFGRIVAIGAIERIAAGSRARPAHFWEAVVHRHHVPLGAVFAERWRLPQLVVDAIRGHHAEEDEGASLRPQVEVVRVVDAVVRLLGERAGVSSRDLATIAGLKERETAALVRLLRVLPAFIAALDGFPDRSGPDLLDRRAEPPPSESRGAGVRVRVCGQELVALGMGPHQLALRGSEPLPENGLVEVEVLERRRFTFHARVLLTWPDRGGFGAVLMPFGLSGPALLDWAGLVPASATA